jgi:hypothetical protein
MTMQHLEVIPEHQMVAHFLKTEIRSVRFEETILALLRRDGRERRLIDEPDLDSEEENAYRAGLLGEWRGYKRHEGIFLFVPDDTAWHRYALRRDELAQVRYIDYDYWIELSGGTRRAIDAARNIRAGIEVFGQSTQWALGMAREVARGARFPELILVGTDEASDLTVLEGHARLTAYCLALEQVPEPLPVILGFGAGMERV